MAKFNIGSTALVIKTYTLHENLGRSVLVEAIVLNGKKFRSPITNSRCENASGDTLYLVTGNIKNPFKGEDGWCLFAGHQLMRIDGEKFILEGERQKELII